MDLTQFPNVEVVLIFFEKCFKFTSSVLKMGVYFHENNIKLLHSKYFVFEKAFKLFGVRQITVSKIL